MRSHFFILLLFFGLLAGCGGENSPATTRQVEPAEPDDRYKIVSTTAMVADIVKHVAGDRAIVITLMKEGVDPHLFKPLTSDTKEMLSADVIFYSGLMLEGRMQDNLIQANKNGLPTIAVTESIDKSYLREPPEFEGHYDPHVWMDVAAWSQCTQLVADKLAKFDTAHAEEYYKNAKAYRQELTQLDDYIRQVIKTIPEQQRVLITAHDAFGYFSQAYNIPVRSVQGISTESESSIDDINTLVDFIIERNINAIFVESSVSPRSIRAIIQGVHKRQGKLSEGGTLFSDAMGAPGTYEGTYIGMLDHNATIITNALGGRAPVKGMQGKLNATTQQGNETDD